ncbi:MAG: hypothetical protein PHO02_01590 [Candidatus Nanoarchaeia archaeon]|nr:hypothetical protein [Candidatus Nanoarchaeia archaeon]
MFLKLVGDSPLMKVTDFLIENKGMDFCKKDIAEGAGISRTSLFYCWNDLEKAGVLKLTRKFGKTTLYTLDAKNQIVKKMLELEMALIEKFIDSESEKRVLKQIAVIKR